jgi:cell volume regulation protein A
MAGGTAIFTSRPWAARDGDPARPASVGGVEVVGHLRRRLDRPGALVALADGRYAVTGATVAIGSARQLEEAARRRLRRAPSASEVMWWREALDVLASLRRARR